MVSGITTLADIKEIESVPLDRRDLPTSTYDAIRQGAAKNPNKVALHFFMRGAEYKEVIFYTFEDLISLINQAANMFNGLGIGNKDVISMILPNLPQSAFTIWGGQAAGIINPINPLLEAEQMAEIMNAAGSKLLVTLAPFIGTDIWQKVAAIAGEVPTLEVILRVDLANYLSTLQKWAVKWMLLREDKGPKLKIPVYDFGQTARKYTGEKLFSERQVQAGDIAAYIPSSDTTKPQKLAKITHFNQTFSAWSLAETLSIAAEQNVFCGLPLYQIPNLIVSNLLPWMQGSSVILGSPSGFREDGVLANFWEIIDFYKINYFNAGQNLYQSLSNLPIGENDSSSLQFALCLADKNPDVNFQQIEAQLKAPVAQVFGFTETMGISSVNPGAGRQRDGSIGLRLPYQEMRIAHLDDEGRFVKFCASQENGTIILRGPNIFAGYKDEDQQAITWVDTEDGQGLWLNSGVTGRQDEQAYFWLKP